MQMKDGKCFAGWMWIVSFACVVGDAARCPEEKRLAWWGLSEVADSGWRNSPGAAGQPRSAEALPARPEGRPAPGWELQVRWQRFPSDSPSFESRDPALAVVPPATPHQGSRSCPARSHVLMGRTTFLMTYKVSPLVFTHHREQDSPSFNCNQTSACFLNDRQLGKASRLEISPSGCFLGHISTSRTLQMKKFCWTTSPNSWKPQEWIIYDESSPFVISGMSWVTFMPQKHHDCRILTGNDSWVLILIWLILWLF